eukprot:320250_1
MASKSLTRAIYKSFLRTCGNGRYPEIFNDYTSLFTITESTAMIPCTAKQTRTLLRNEFEKNDDDIDDMFAVLRRCNDLASILYPQITHLPKQMPIFDYSLSASLIGEQRTYNFFEPRYIKLAQDAISTSNNNGMFILRGKLRNDEGDKISIVSVLVKIMQHEETEDGNIIVECVCGPRIQILKEESINIRTAEPTLSRAIEFVLDYDDINNDKDIDLISVRKQCLDLMLETLTMTDILSIGLPPLDPEYFSFWSLRFFLEYNDIASRLNWLACKSTFERLQFVIDLLLASQRPKNKYFK